MMRPAPVLSPNAASAPRLVSPGYPVSGARRVGITGTTNPASLRCRAPHSGGQPH
jgi:hypothetical protein